MVTRSGPGTAQVAGDRGLGIVVAHRANRVAIEIARENGIGAVGVSNSSHCGAVGLYSRVAAREGLIGMAFTHSDKIAAPHGGHRPFLGTNPISMAFPRDGARAGVPGHGDHRDPVEPGDERAARGRRDRARRGGGRRRPRHHRRPDRQRAAPARRAGLRPQGLRPGADRRAAVRPANGNPCGPQIGPMYAELERPRRIGAFFVVLDPNRFAGGPTFAATVEHMARALAAEPGAPRMPGDPELAAQARRRIAGIPIEPGLAAEMRSWSARLGVASPL